MKTIKFLMLTMSLIATSVQAERIDVETERNGNPITGKSNKVCIKTTFIKRNSGALITGLTSSNIKIAYSESSLIKSFTYSLTASTKPILPGLYDFCVTPKDSTWLNSYGYISIFVNGTTSADNGYESIGF